MAGPDEIDASSDEDESRELRRLIGFDPGRLRSVEAASVDAVLRWQGGWTIRLDSGREVYVGRWHQYAIYAGLLAGVPRGTSWIERYLLRAIRQAEALFGEAGFPVLMLEPVLRSLPLPGRPAVLPPVCTIAELNSSEPARDERECYSSLIVVWFSDRFGLPQEEGVLRQLRAIDWEREAGDWTP